MKESTLIFKILVAVLCIGVAAYMAFYLLQGFEEDLVTTTAFAYSQNIGIEARGILVREETVLSGSSGYLDLILGEGEKAARGDAVALLYSDPSALNTRQSIRTLEEEVEQLQYALSSGTQGVDAARLDQQVAASVINLRSLASSGDLSSLESSALNLRTTVFKRAYTYEGADAAGQLSQLIAFKQAQLADLNRSLGQVSQTLFAPASGVFSGSVDGWESVITPDMLDYLTIQELNDLLDRKTSGSANAAGKVITSSTWYLAALLPGSSPNLQEGRTYSIAFSDGYYGQVDMKLVRVVLGDGQTLAIFSARSHLADTTLLRVQTVDILTQQIDGIRIPRQALRVVTETVEQTDKETGQTTTKEVNRYLVYTVVSGQAEEQEVEVLYTGDTFYLVRPVREDTAYRLRAGDEVILSTAGVYDGKVVRR